MKIMPIRTRKHYRAALARIDELMDARRGTPEGDELDVWATLVDAYETEHFPIAAPEPVAAIQFRMQQRGLTRKDLEPLIGSRGRVAEILGGKRSLSLPMIRKLHHDWRIPLESLIG
jgi:HTH-type transcriptional regulator / antitoxin HigA